jgi:hypothetical protein
VTTAHSPSLLAGNHFQTTSYVFKSPLRDVCLLLFVESSLSNLLRCSCIIIAKVDGSISGTHGPLPTEVTELRWIKNCVVALTPQTCHLWPDIGSGSEIVLTSIDGDFLQLAASKNFLAVTSSNCRLHCWRMSSLIDAAHSGSQMPSPLTLSSYEAEKIHCLAWDANGRFIATSDCADCTVW